MSVSYPPPPAEQPPPPPPPRPGGRSGGVVAIVVSGLLTLVGFLVLLVGIGVLAIHIGARSDDGFFTVESDQIPIRGYALTTKSVDLGTGGDWAPDSLIEEFRIEADPGGDGDGDLFLGIARADDVDSYLGDVARTEVTEIGTEGTTEDEIEGVAPSGPPASQDFWVAQSSGPGERVVVWEPEGGTYSAVVMNADGSRGVTAALAVGLRITWLLWLGLGVVALGLLFLVPGLVVLIRSFRAPPTPETD